MFCRTIFIYLCDWQLFGGADDFGLDWSYPKFRSHMKMGDWRPEKKSLFFGNFLAFMEWNWNIGIEHGKYVIRELIFKKDRFWGFLWNICLKINHSIGKSSTKNMEMNRVKTQSESIHLCSQFGREKLSISIISIEKILLFFSFDFMHNFSKENHFIF